MTVKYNNVFEDELSFNSFSISSSKTSDERFSTKNRIIRYHYTSSKNFLKIITDKPSLRFTDINYLNDHSEMVYCVKCILEFLNNHNEIFPFFKTVVDSLLLNNHAAEEYINLSVSTVDFADNKIYPYNPSRCFVFCMSEAQDSLSMWNYYVQNGKYEGYNIGFDVYDFLKSFDSPQEKVSDPITCHYGKVIYKKREQEEAIRKLAEYIERDSNRAGETAIAHNMVNLQHYIESHGIFFKDEAFKDEREYRIALIVSNPRINSSRENYVNENLKKMQLGFDEKNGIIVPFMSIPFNKNSVKKITMSPIIEKSIAERSLLELLNNKGYSAKVVASKIPIRF